MLLREIRWIVAEEQNVEDAPDPRAFSNDLEQVVLQLNSRFGRLPSDNEVYRYIWGGPNVRQRIWDNKGLPEALR
jgi:hypothetical protein